MKPLSTEPEVYFSPETRERVAANLRGIVPTADVDIIELTPVLRGGPGSGHFGHSGRPGKFGGSQPSDFHSAEPGAYGKGFDAGAMEVLTPGLPISPEDAKWLEAWFAKNTTAVDPTQHETLVGPSGKAYAVDGFGGHDSAGQQALGALGQNKIDEGGAVSEFTVKPIVAEGDWMIETYAEDVGPDGDGWDRDPDGTLTFTFLTIVPGAAAKVPIKYRIEKHDDEYQIITGSSRDAVRPSTLFKFVYNAQEIAGKERHIGLESEDKAKQFVEAMLFGDARQINVDVYPIGGEARSYEFTRLPGEALEAIGLDPEKNIIPDYNWTDNQVPPFVAGTVEEVAEKTGDYFASRRDKSKKPEPYSLNLAMGRITGEDGILAMGFLRVSRGFAGTSGQVPEVGMSWNRTAGLTEAQKRVAVKVARNTIEEGGRFSYERFNGYDLQSQRWGDVQSGYFAEWPDRLFTGVVQGADINDLLSRSFDDLPAWALRLLIQRGGPGSGHFGHEGRPGKVGGSAPSDFHSAEGQGPKPGDMVDCPRCGGKGYIQHYQHVAEGVCFQCGGDKKVPFVPGREPKGPNPKWVATITRIREAREALLTELYLPKPGEPITNPALLEMAGLDRRALAEYGPIPDAWPADAKETWERNKMIWAGFVADKDRIFQRLGEEKESGDIMWMFGHTESKAAKKEKEFMEVFDKDPEGFIEQDISKARAAFSAKAQKVSGEQAEVDAFFQSWKPPENALTAKLAVSVTKHGYDWVKGNKLVKLSVPEASQYSVDNSTKMLEDIGARPVVEVKKSASGNWWYIVKPLAEGRFAMHQFSQYDWNTEKGPTSQINEQKRGDWEWKFARPYVLNFIKQNSGG